MYLLTLAGNLLVALERLYDAALGIAEGELVYPVTAAEQSRAAL